MALLAAIYTAPAAGAPMEFKERVRAIAGTGLEGDRYATGSGFWKDKNPEKERKIRHVTLISAEAIVAANDWLNLQNLKPYYPAETRRNLLLFGVDPTLLNTWVEKEFAVGSVRMRGVELADPCQRP